MPSFDVVSKVDHAELDNAVNQAQRELAQRFDFKDTGSVIEKSEHALEIRSSAEDRARAALEVLKEKLIRRKVSLKHIQAKDPEPGPKGSTRIRVEIKEGIDQDKARQMVKLIKDSKLKVQAAITEQSVRVTGKKRDELQQIIQLLRAASDLDLDLQFTNYRD